MLQDLNLLIDDNFQNSFKYVFQWLLWAVYTIFSFTYVIKKADKIEILQLEKFGVKIAMVTYWKRT